MTGTRLIAIERSRQVLIGYDQEHDQEHTQADLAARATHYLRRVPLTVDDLAKAGALCAAAIDRAQQ